MSTTDPARDLGPLDRLVERAETLAGAWAARARSSTTVGRERAILRMFGVSGLDRAGRPLAAEVVERYLAGQSGRLASGIALPFAVALLEYDIAPQALALDAASGAVDLGLEAELLKRADRRTAAEGEARRLAAAALDRIDANRVARSDLLGVLGDGPRPWVGASVLAADLDGARAEAGRLVREGADLVRVAVPAGRELADRLHDVGVDLPGWRPRNGGLGVDDLDATPAGAQRGLTEIRRAVDEAAAERRSYARLATVAPPLYAPEQAVVAAFERVDAVLADAVAEIVDGSVDPDRALADHAFAHWLHRRAGAQLIVGAGPLVVAPDLARGLPSDPATRAGRALALQLLGVALARNDGLTPAQILVGALPEWLTEERDPAVQALAAATLRRAIFPGHPLVFEEPILSPRAAAAWPFVLAGALAVAGDTALIHRRPAGNALTVVSAQTRALRQVTAEIGVSTTTARLAGPALAHAQAAVKVAETTLDRLADSGWRAVLGESLAGREATRLGADAVAERSDPFDPFVPSGQPARA